MSITTTSVLPAPIQQSFSFKLLSVAVPYMIHKIPAELKAMPRNGGTTLRMRRYNPLATAPVPLGNSGITPPPQTLTSLNIDKTCVDVKLLLIDSEAREGDEAQALMAA
jgi:N4-gp56 family major capsid protein